MVLHGFVSKSGIAAQPSVPGGWRTVPVATGTVVVPNAERTASDRKGGHLAQRQALGCGPRADQVERTQLT